MFLHVPDSKTKETKKMVRTLKQEAHADNWIKVSLTAKDYAPASWHPSFSLKSFPLQSAIVYLPFQPPCLEHRLEFLLYPFLCLMANHNLRNASFQLAFLIHVVNAQFAYLLFFLCQRTCIWWTPAIPARVLAQSRKVHISIIIANTPCSIIIANTPGRLLAPGRSFGKSTIWQGFPPCPPLATNWMCRVAKIYIIKVILGTFKWRSGCLGWRSGFGPPFWWGVFRKLQPFYPCMNPRTEFCS